MMLRWSDQNGIRQLAMVVAANLVVNLIFFMTHPVFYSVLYNSHRDVFALDFAVRNSDSTAGRHSG
jgi:hypothetical protein